MALFVFDHRAYRHVQKHIVSRSATPISTLPRFTAFGPVFATEHEIEQRAPFRVGSKHDGTTVPAVPACGSTARPAGLATKGHAAIAAVSTAHENRTFIHKLHEEKPRRSKGQRNGRRKPRKNPTAAHAATDCASWMELFAGWKERYAVPLLSEATGCTDTRDLFPCHV
jgi:hypothetical protein